MTWAAWQYGLWSDKREPIPVAGLTVRVSDGDSFAIGNRKLRLDGIDAPEYRQTCDDAQGKPWECGKAARASLEQLLLLPGLACTATAQDRYARGIATCSVQGVEDIAAAQVTAGMAVSHEFYGMRDYGNEEDSARAAKQGIWRGSFETPSDWRDSHTRTD